MPQPLTHTAPFAYELLLDNTVMCIKSADVWLSNANAAWHCWTSIAVTEPQVYVIPLTYITL